MVYYCGADLSVDEDGLLSSLQEVASREGLPASRDGGEAFAYQPSSGQARAAAEFEPVCGHLEETQGVLGVGRARGGREVERREEGGGEAVDLHV